MSFKSKFYGPDVKNIKEVSFSIYTNDMVKKNLTTVKKNTLISVSNSYVPPEDIS